MAAEVARIAFSSPDLEMKFKSPADFIACSLEPVPSFTLNKLCSSSTELWLIKAPADFNPKCFNSRKVPLCGFQTVKSKKDEANRLYSIFSNARDPDSSYLLVPSSEKGQLACGPAFSGCLNVCESLSDSTANNPLKAIAASPALHIPEGLKQRFQPFGATSPDSDLPTESHLKKSSKRRKVPVVEAGRKIPKTKKKKEEVAGKFMGRARQLKSMNPVPIEGEESWDYIAQGVEAQGLSMDTTDAKKKKRETDGAGDDIAKSQEQDEEMRSWVTTEEADVPTVDKQKHHHKKRKRKPIKEGFVLAAEEESSSFQDKIEKVLLGESELTVTKADRKQKCKKKNKKSKHGLSDSFVSMPEEQSSGFHEKTEREFLEDRLVPTTEEHGSGTKKKKKQWHHASHQY